MKRKNASARDITSTAKSANTKASKGTADNMNKPAEEQVEELRSGLFKNEQERLNQAAMEASIEESKLAELPEAWRQAYRELDDITNKAFEQSKLERIRKAQQQQQEEAQGPHKQQKPSKSPSKSRRRSRSRSSRRSRRAARRKHTEL